MRSSALYGKYVQLKPVLSRMRRIRNNRYYPQVVIIYMEYSNRKKHFHANRIYNVLRNFAKKFGEIYRNASKTRVSSRPKLQIASVHGEYEYGVTLLTLDRFHMM